MSKFIINYDDQQLEIVDKIGSVLYKNHGLQINELEGGDGYCEYEIVKRDDL